MRRVTDYLAYLIALKRHFHGGQMPGEYYKPAGEFHSLGARCGLHDANGNRLDKNGNVIGRDAAFCSVTNSTNPYPRKPMGAWLR
jgi:hypothetical protein